MSAEPKRPEVETGETAPESGEIAVAPGQPGVPTSGTVNGSHTYLDEG